MRLFDTIKSDNLLPFEGNAYYYGKIFNTNESLHYYSLLLDSINWQNDEVVIFGKKIITNRKIAFYAISADLNYKYSKITKNTAVFIPVLLEIKEKIEIITNQTFNSCLLNLYQNGNEGMGWHSDNEKELKENGTIASISFGAERNFSFKHNHSKLRIAIKLENGSLLTMENEIQKFWKHSMPKSTKIMTPRINLTFRTII
jgi:alkylated DNA repair dioxygenase AlkB